MIDSSDPWPPGRDHATLEHGIGHAAGLGHVLPDGDPRRTMALPPGKEAPMPT
jgi:hypothetical protein